MNVIVMLMLALAGCAVSCEAGCQERPRPLTLVAPDAVPDADADHDCCHLLPDQEAVRGCVAVGLKPGVCGVIACPAPDGSFTKISVCGAQPLDAGVDTP